MSINSFAVEAFAAIRIDPNHHGVPAMDQDRIPRRMRRIDLHTAMTIPTSVTFRGMAASAPLREKIKERAQWLDRFAEDILACNVVVSACERKHQQGNRYNVHAAATLRDRTIETGRTPSPDASHEDAYLAVAHTFDALRRRIEDHVRRRRGDVKARAVTP